MVSAIRAGWPIHWPPRLILAPLPPCPLVPGGLASGSEVAVAVAPTDTTGGLGVLPLGNLWTIVTASLSNGNRALALPSQIERGRASHVRDFGMPELLRPLVGPQRTDLVALFFEQDCEVERAVGVAALIRSPVGGLGGCPVAVLFEQHTEIGRGGGMAEPVGSLVGRPSL